MKFKASNKGARYVMYLACVGTVFGLVMFSWYWLIASLVMFQFYWIVGLSAGNHRYFTHRAFNTTRLWEEIMIWAACTSQSGHPGMYAIVHLEHHRLSDTEADPHRLYGDIMSTTQFKGVRLTTAMKRAFISNKLMKRVYDTYLLYPCVTALVLCMISPLAFAYLWAIPTLAMQFARRKVTLKWIHQFGYQTFDTGDNSKNSKLLSWLFGGEGLHNNHHRFPNRWNFAVNAGEFDPTALFIRAIRK